jgi:hypothetical protein
MGPGFAPETREQNASNRRQRDKRALNPLKIFAERSLHTGEVVGSIPTAPGVGVLAKTARIFPLITPSGFVAAATVFEIVLICEHSDAKGRAADTKEPTIECTSRYDFWKQLFHRRPPGTTLNYCVAAT